MGRPAVARPGADMQRHLALQGAASGAQLGGREPAVDRDHRLVLDAPLPIAGPSRVRVIILVAEEEIEIAEQEWLRAASANPAFEFLKDPEEDIYTLADGKPFDDQG